MLTVVKLDVIVKNMFASAVFKGAWENKNCQKNVEIRFVLVYV
jgi:hypothetical protein